MREDKRLSIRDASKAARFSAATWTALEKGYKTPTANNRVPYGGTVENVVAAAEVVGMDPAQALELAGLDPAKAPAVRDGRRTVGEREILHLFAQLDADTKDALITLLRSLAFGVTREEVDGRAADLPPVGEVSTFAVKRTSTSGGC